MKRKRLIRRITGLVLLAFITANAFLIYFDDEDRVERKSYVEHWSQSITYDLFEKLQTKGVFTAEETNPVYFNEDQGSFKEFLVKEGQSVSQGDDLYTYEVLNYTQKEAELESKVDKIEEEIDAIEDYIDELEDYDVPDPDDEDSEDSNEPPSYVETKYLREAEVAKQEAQLAKKEAMLTMVEDQLDQLQSDGEEITVTSPYDGTVTQVSKTLEAPLLTLNSESLHIEGEFSEEERKEIEADMPTRVHVPELDLELAGTLASVHTYPENPDVHRSSQYPFEVTVEKMDEQILPGYHAKLEVITESSLGAVTAIEKALVTKKNLYAWVMNEEGELERRKVETGITENGLVEITEGLEEGEWLAYHPKDEFRKQATFFTPIHLEDLEVDRLFKSDLGSKTTYGLLGLLSR